MDLGDIFLTATTTPRSSMSSISTSTEDLEVDANCLLTKLRFGKFWEALILCALTAFKENTTISAENKIKAMLQMMTKHLEDSSSQATHSRWSGNSFHGKKSQRMVVNGGSSSAISGKCAHCFSEKFMSLWAEDGFRDYLLKEKSASATDTSGRGVLRRLSYVSSSNSNANGNGSGTRSGNCNSARRSSTSNSTNNTNNNNNNRVVRTERRTGTGTQCSTNTAFSDDNDNNNNDDDDSEEEDEEDNNEEGGGDGAGLYSGDNNDNCNGNEDIFSLDAPIRRISLLSTPRDRDRDLNRDSYRDRGSYGSNGAGNGAGNSNGNGNGSHVRSLSSYSKSIRNIHKLQENKPNLNELLKDALNESGLSYRYECSQLLDLADNDNDGGGMIV